MTKYSSDLYGSLIEELWIQKMNFCGCGMPDICQEYIMDVLGAMKERRDSDWKINKVDEALKSSPEAAEYMVLYMLDAMGLTEHGGSVGGSWLTDKGEALLDLSGETT